MGEAVVKRRLVFERDSALAGIRVRLPHLDGPGLGLASSGAPSALRDRFTSVARPVFRVRDLAMDDLMVLHVSQLLSCRVHHTIDDTYCMAMAYV